MLNSEKHGADTFQGTFFAKDKSTFFVHSFNKYLLRAYSAWHSSGLIGLSDENGKENNCDYCLLSTSHTSSLALGALHVSLFNPQTIHYLGGEADSEK